MIAPPGAQHAWEATFAVDPDGRPLAPRFHRLLMLDVRGTPTRPDVRHLESALRELERRFERGPSGLLMCLGWGPTWFERHTTHGSPVARPVPMAPWEDPELEEIDACLHLASDDESRLARVADELFRAGPLDQRTRLRLRETRIGFAGAGLPAQRVAAARAAPAGPLLLGFHSGLRGNQASERADHDHERAAGRRNDDARQPDRAGPGALVRTGPRPPRRAHVLPVDRARAAATLVDDAPSDADRLPALAARHGLVGHAQAAGRARLYGRPRINRRDFATLDDGRPGTHFVSLQRSIADFNATRAVMNAADAHTHHDAIGARRHNGINAFMDVRSRANFAVPPRSRRAYPGLETGTAR